MVPASSERRNSSIYPLNVVVLGVVSLLMGMSSAMIYGLLPVFLVTVLGAGMATVGLIEGIAEATTSAMKIFSGALSDLIGRRKPLVLLRLRFVGVEQAAVPAGGDCLHSADSANCRSDRQGHPGCSA